jgi:hypothetical protein
MPANNSDAIAVEPAAVLLCYSLAHGYSQKGFDSRAGSLLDRSMHAPTAADVASLMRRKALLLTIKRCFALAAAMHSSLSSLGKASPSTCNCRQSRNKIATKLAVSMVSGGRGRSGRLSLNAVAQAERMLKSVSAETLSDVEIKKLLQRPRIDFTSILGTVGGLAAAAAPAGPLSQPRVAI